MQDGAGKKNISIEWRQEFVVDSECAMRNIVLPQVVCNLFFSACVGDEKIKLVYVYTYLHIFSICHGNQSRTSGACRLFTNNRIANLCVRFAFQTRLINFIYMKLFGIHRSRRASHIHPSIEDINTYQFHQSRPYDGYDWHNQVQISASMRTQARTPASLSRPKIASTKRVCLCVCAGAGAGVTMSGAQ